MNGFKEIQKIIKNFVEESKQAKQQISEIERKRVNLAQDRNSKKEANTEKYLTEINALGKQISELGNKSQELQNKLDKHFCELKKLVNLMIDNQITDEMRKIRKINESKEEYLEKISLQEERKARYEMQKQEFYQRFGRIPEISEKAKQEDEIQDKQCKRYKERIQAKQEKIEKCEKELVKWVELKKDVANKNWAKIICDENEEEIIELPLVEEIEIEEMEPIQEVEVEEFQPIEEIEIEEFDVEPFKDIKEENIEVSKNIIKEKNENEIDEIEELAKAIVEQIVAEQTKEIEKNQIEEQDIIAYEEKKTEKYDISTNEPPVLSNIIIKIENNEIVYKAQISNGEEVRVIPTKLASENALLNIKEEVKKEKEELINYATREYRPLEKNIIKRIDPIVCRLLNEFANTYNYDAGNLIYNYAMSFAKNEIIRTEFVSITYNLAYINEANLSKVEKREFLRICKKATKNENIDVIGQDFSFCKIKYMFKRLFEINSVDRLPEGKY